MKLISKMPYLLDLFSLVVILEVLLLKVLTLVMPFWTCSKNRHFASMQVGQIQQQELAPEQELLCVYFYFSFAFTLCYHWKHGGCTFLQDRPTVTSSGALFGLLGTMLLITI